MTIKVSNFISRFYYFHTMLMKLIAIWLIIFAGCISGCKKASDDNLLSYTITVESANATGGITVNKCYLDLYNGKSFAYDEAKAHALNLDFFYYYTIASPPILYVRGFDDIRFCGASTGFDTVTTSLIDYASNYGVSAADFDNLKTSGDIDRLQSQKQIDWTGNEIRAEVSNLNDDSPYCQIFAFVTNNRKKGFFKILPYTTQVPATDKAPLTLVVKIQR